MADRIRINGIACRCRIGVPARERRARQRILVDAALEADLRAAGRTDSLRRSVDYHALEKLLCEEAEAGVFSILERLAEVLARAALAFDKRVRSVTIVVRKSPAAMPKTREVAVEITRGRH
ncbi:MAG: dihydroneopterin aldolase [Elusimicrobiota bacterium]